MESKIWRHEAVPTLAGLAVGLVTIIVADDLRIIGGCLFVASLVAISLLKIKKWLTDTSVDREHLRHAIRTAEEQTQLAQVGRALQLAERERERSSAEEARRTAARTVDAAQRRIEQNEINIGMRAHSFEEGCEKRYAEKLAAGIAEAQKIASEEIAAARLELENERAALMLSQFRDGVLAERSGEVDDMLASMEDPRIIHLDDHRRQPSSGKSAGGSTS